MGLAVRVPGIVPRGPAASLLSVASRLPQGVDWRSGVAFRETHDFTAGRWSQCPGVNDVKATPSGAGQAKFFPFMGYVVAQCDWITDEVRAEFDPEIQAQMDASSAWSLSRELWTGDTNAGTGDVSPSLQAPFPGEVDEFDTAHIVSATGLNPINALGLLLEAYNDGTFVGGATLHVPTRLMTRLISAYDIQLQGATHVVPGMALVSPGPGYPGSGATGPRTAAHSGGATAGANETWVYVTPPVEYEMAPVTLEPENADNRYYDRRTNQYFVLGERSMIYRFDPDSVWACLVTIPTGS